MAELAVSANAIKTNKLAAKGRVKRVVQQNMLESSGKQSTSEPQARAAFLWENVDVLT